MSVRFTFTKRRRATSSARLACTVLTRRLPWQLRLRNVWQAVCVPPVDSIYEKSIRRDCNRQSALVSWRSAHVCERVVKCVIVKYNVTPNKEMRMMPPTSLYRLRVFCEDCLHLECVPWIDQATKSLVSASVDSEWVVNYLTKASFRTFSLSCASSRIAGYKAAVYFSFLTNVFLLKVRLVI